MRRNADILIVDDEEHMLALLKKVLERQGFSVHTTSRGMEAIELLKDQTFDLLLTDLVMPEIGGMEILKEAKDLSPETFVVIMTGFGSIDSAVQAMKAGAYHYISKPFKMDEVRIVIERALEEKKLRQEVASLRNEVRKKYSFDNIIGKSKVMQELFDLIQRIAKSKATVMIYGKSGTGKELVAKAIHYNSPRRKGPFVVVNCSALPETLLESELFGHVKGAFTGAMANKKGLFEEAQGGTIFLDEIGEISQTIQVKLLRVLQEGEIKRVGESSSIRVDFRLIAATNRDLKEAVAEGRFREDLFYRLNVIPLILPELRERREDIPLLAHHFLLKYGQENSSEIRDISKEAMEILVNYPWPGNVRELENVIERAITLGRSQTILLSDLPPYMREEQSAISEKNIVGDVSLEEMEKAHIEQVLKKTGGHQTNAAAILGIDRRTLHRKIKIYRLKFSES
ncbi:MAG: sigma-54-dependent Fis family transcriptional regulator [Candidatus Tectomicrobia bacterium]|nr:sigma-54-dependent Fis family transcriptional regulator [Candidatus Tectomicrobia bacterium]